MRRLPLLLLTGGVSGLLLVPGSATPQATGDEGLELLLQAAQAGDRVAFHGTQLVAFWSRGGTTSAMVEVTHDPQQGSLLRLHANASGAGRVFVDKTRSEAGVGLTPQTLALIADNYDTEVTGTDRVAGRRTDVVVVRVPGGRPVAKYWLDRATRLPLRREVLDEDGGAVRESVFIDIDFAPAALPRMAAAEEVPGHDGVPVALAAVPRLATSGWYVPREVPGLALFDVRLAAGSDPVLHLTYSDGMSSVSLFQQRGRLDTGSLDGWRHTRMGGARVWVGEGFPTRVAWSSNGMVYTLVAECPRQVLDGFVRALPHGERRPGVLTRLGRGVVRVGSWVNPFA